MEYLQIGVVIILVFRRYESHSGYWLNSIQLVSPTNTKGPILTLHVVGSRGLNSRGRWPGAGGAVHSFFHVVSRSRVGTPNIAYPNPFSIIRYWSDTKRTV